MRRNVHDLAAREYDLLVIGGGVYGAVCAWDATLRGLKVALLDRGDFGGATSANSAKIGHTGLRYLQHADVKRLRESVHEAAVLRQIAPHLVGFRPFLLPLYGHGIKGPETMSVYCAIYNLLSADRRQQSQDPARRFPKSRIVSRNETLAIAPDIREEGLTGGAIWYEGQMHHIERLVLSYVRSAAERGAEVANYVNVIGFLRTGNRITGVEARDQLTGHDYSIRAKLVLNATGPWLAKTLNLADVHEHDHDLPPSKAFSIVTRPLTNDYAVAFPIKTMYQDRQAVVDKQTSLSFIIPWGRYSLVGSLHKSCPEDPDAVGVTLEEVQSYISMVNEGYPAAKLRLEDVRYLLWGMVPADEPGSAAPLKHPRILDHATEGGPEGLVSVMGVKFTTSRGVAERTVDLAMRKLGREPSRCITHTTPVYGGDIASLDAFTEEAIAADSGRHGAELMRHLVRCYGTAYPRVLDYCKENRAWDEPIAGTEVIRAEVIHAVREEMAQKLGDVVLRRTELGVAGHAGDDAVHETAELMASELGWSSARIDAEIREVDEHYMIRPLELGTESGARVSQLA